MRRLAVGPARCGVVPVRFSKAVLEPPAVVSVVDVLGERGVLVAGGESTGVSRIVVKAVVVVPAAARTVEPLECREDVLVGRQHDLADDAAAARDDEHNHLCGGGRHLVRLTFLVQSFSKGLIYRLAEPVISNFS